MNKFRVLIIMALKNINPALSDCFKGGKKQHKKNDPMPSVAPAPSQG